MAKTSLENSRPWTIKDLYNRMAHLRALPIIVLEKWENYHGAPGADRLTTSELHEELLERGLLEKAHSSRGKGNLIGSLIQKQKYRNLKPTLVEPVDIGVWRFNVRHYEDLLREFRERYPVVGESASTGEPLEKKPLISGNDKKSYDMQPKSMAIIQLLEQYDREWQKRLEESEAERRHLQAENEAIRRKLEKSTSILNEVTDDELRDRIRPLLALKQLSSDTLVREASAVFEHRLRTAHGLESTEYGVRLVGALLNPESGTLVFSQDANAQRGVMMLYEGALKFIRNPPMHGLVEYSETRVRIYIRMLDSLLQLLSESERRLR
jgi:hypothetical protein